MAKVVPVMVVVALLAEEAQVVVVVVEPGLNVVVGTVVL